MPAARTARAIGQVRLSTIPEKHWRPLVRCAQGDLPPNVALMHLLMEARDPADVGAAVDAALEELAPLEAEQGLRLDRLAEVARLHADNPGAWSIVRKILAGMEHDGPASSPDDGIRAWSAAFDRAARISPEAGVALYSLGNPALLERATSDVIERLAEWDVLAPDHFVLEVGCGVGRFLKALAARTAQVVGIDISPVMVSEARRRCAGLSNVAVLRCFGRDLSFLRDEAFDLVLAVDTFPYLVQSGPGLAARHVEEAARVLRTGGHLLILNLSYRGDLDLDRSDLAAWSAPAGFRAVLSGTREFTNWDGSAFLLRKGRA